MTMAPSRSILPSFSTPCSLTSPPIIRVKTPFSATKMISDDFDLPTTVPLINMFSSGETPATLLLTSVFFSWVFSVHLVLSFISIIMDSGVTVLRPKTPATSNARSESSGSHGTTLPSGSPGRSTCITGICELESWLLALFETLYPKACPVTLDFP